VSLIQPHVGVIAIATGVYSSLFNDFCVGCSAFFLPRVRRSVYLFTDKPATSFEFSAQMSKLMDVVVCPVSSCEWPWPTLNRFQYTKMLVKALVDAKRDVPDYLFFININARFVTEIHEDEILSSNLVATLHPGFFDKPKSVFTYERNPNSAAYIPHGHGDRYLAGGLQGGRTSDVLAAYDDCIDMLRRDMAAGVMAVWHDESYWNKYLFVRGYKDVQFLDPGYLYPEGSILPFVPKIMLLRKDHFFDFTKSPK
jgi:hypothetical protein